VEHGEDDHYALLGVSSNVDRRTLRAAYLARMRLHHPDHRPEDPGDVARRLNAAYEVLSDPVRRAAYDRSRRARSTAAGTDGVRPMAAGSRPGAAPRGARTIGNPAYSEANQSYYRKVSAALVRIGAGIFTIGLVLLVALSA
jgi:curved DNA-binding protein CbpA